MKIKCDNREVFWLPPSVKNLGLIYTMNYDDIFTKLLKICEYNLSFTIRLKINLFPFKFYPIHTWTGSNKISWRLNVNLKSYSWKYVFCFAGEQFDQYQIQTVEPFVSAEDTPWIETTTGLAVVITCGIVGFILIVLIIVIIAYLCCRRHRPQSR